VHGAVHETVTLEPAQSQSQHALADAVDLTAQLGETLGALTEQLDDEQ
jgi:hypothetical protein